jgi:formylglycine-generating enzyme required for sulfatase activity
MRVLPPGRFMMGSPPEDPNRAPAEGPLHEVRIARPFAMAVDDVTRAQFAVFVRETHYDTNDPACDWRAPKSRGRPFAQSDDDPVICVSWADARAYAAWLSARTGRSYRLPSEAEWEYAARAGVANPHAPAGAAARNLANYGTDGCCAPFAAGRDRWLYTSPVDAFPPNAFGLHDMLGNVWQRVMDCGHGDYAGAPRDGSAWLIGGDCSQRVVRGGSWFSAADQLRIAARAIDPAAFRKNDIGFRLVRTLSPARRPARRSLNRPRA